MPKPKQCKLIGGISIILAIAVIVVSALLLAVIAQKSCKDSDKSEGSFEYHGDDGGVHGGQTGGDGYKSPPHFASLKKGYHNNLKEHDDDDDFYHIAYYCHVLPKRLEACAGTGIAAGIVQILISALYCFSTKKNVKLFSGLWVVVHVLIIIALVAAFSIVLSNKWGKNSYEKLSGQKHIQPKALAFSAVIGINVIILILLMVFVVTTFKKSDYDDYSVGYEKDDQQQVAASR